MNYELTLHQQFLILKIGLFPDNTTTLKLMEKDYNKLFFNFVSQIVDEIKLNEFSNDHIENYYDYLVYLNNKIKDESLPNSFNTILNLIKSPDFILSDGYLRILTNKTNLLPNEDCDSLFFERHSIYDSIYFLEDNERDYIIEKILSVEGVLDIPKNRDFNYLKVMKQLDVFKNFDSIYKSLKKIDKDFAQNYLNFHIYKLFESNGQNSENDENTNIAFFETILEKVLDNSIEIDINRLSSLLDFLIHKKNNYETFFNLIIQKIDKNKMNKDLKEFKFDKIHLLFSDIVLFNYILKYNFKVEYNINLSDYSESVSLNNFNFESQLFIIQFKSTKLSDNLKKIVELSFFEIDDNGLLNIGTQHRDLININLKN